MPIEDDRRWSLHEREHEKAEKILDRRLDDLNQLRKEVVVDRNQFVSASTYAAEHQAIKNELRGKIDVLNSRIDAVEKLIDRAEGAVNTWRFIAGFLGITGISAIVWALMNMPR